MAKKKTEEKTVHRPADPNVMGLRADGGGAAHHRARWTTNYMPYAMSVIVSRAIPEIDGFKPSHRKLLYTMYKMGLLTGGAHQVRQHRGPDHAPQPPRRSAAIYETMVRLAKGYECAAAPLCGQQGQLRQGLFP